MQVDFVKHINRDKKNRMEFLLCNYPYADGSDWLAKFFEKENGLHVTEKTDGIYYSIIKAYKNDIEYTFMWHEDIGNLAYCMPQSPENNKNLENELKAAIKTLNKLLKK